MIFTLQFYAKFCESLNFKACRILRDLPKRESIVRVSLEVYFASRSLIPGNYRCQQTLTEGIRLFFFAQMNSFVFSNFKQEY